MYSALADRCIVNHMAGHHLGMPIMLVHASQLHGTTAWLKLPLSSLAS